MVLSDFGRERERHPRRVILTAAAVWSVSRVSAAATTVAMSAKLACRYVDPVVGVANHVVSVVAEVDNERIGKEDEREREGQVRGSTGMLLDSKQ